jgi:hypothetical protein
MRNRTAHECDNLTLCLFAESCHMGYNIHRNHLDIFCLSIAIRIMAVNGSRLTQNVLCKAAKTSTALLKQRSGNLHMATSCERLLKTVIATNV